MSHGRESQKSMDNLSETPKPVKQLTTAQVIKLHVARTTGKLREELALKALRSLRLFDKFAAQKRNAARSRSRRPIGAARPRTRRARRSVRVSAVASAGTSSGSDDGDGGPAGGGLVNNTQPKVIRVFARISRHRKEARA